MYLKKMNPYPENNNPMKLEPFLMGTQIGSNLMILHENHKDKDVEYLILVNTKTGERKMFIMDDAKEAEDVLKED